MSVLVARTCWGATIAASMGLAQPVRRFTPQEYYVLERAAKYKSEYFEGEIFAMAGGTSRHSLIIANLTGEVRGRLKGGKCRAYNSDQRVKVTATGLRTYPDLSVFCGRLEYDPEDDQRVTATNPTMVFEVLSKNTESYDRGAKSSNYRQIESLKAYALVATSEPHIELYEMHGDGFWRLSEARGMDAVLQVSALGIQISLAEVYENVDWGEED